MPLNVENSFFTYPIFFSMSFQWTAFPGACGFSSSCIFSTNNFRQFSTALTEFIFSREKSILKKTKFYGLTLFSYHTGAAMAATSSVFMGKNCIFIVLIPIASAFILVFYGNLKKRWRWKHKVVIKFYISNLRLRSNSDCSRQKQMLLTNSRCTLNFTAAFAAVGCNRSIT